MAENVNGTQGHETELVNVQDLKATMQKFKTDKVDVKENTSNKVTSLSGSSTDTQYPSAKCVHDGLAGKADLVDGVVPSSQLPSYVDDVLEYATMSAFPATGESGKIYVDLSTDRTYRWSGTQYTPIKGDLAIGSTTGTAADGGVVNSHITDSTIHVTSTEKQTWNNKQKAIAEGRGITVTTGATADTVSLNLPIYSGSGTNSIAEGSGTTASGEYSHSEGRETEASGYSSHAEGMKTVASGSRSHAEGQSTTASGGYSHAEGIYTKASGDYSHAEGISTEAKGYAPHAEGECTEASGNWSHAEGYYTTASNQSEHASGQYNESNKASTTFGDGGNTLFSVGNGTARNARHNAFEIRQNGDIYLTLGGQDVKLQECLGNKVDKTTTVNGHALSGNVAVTASDVGLGNVGNFKAVSTAANQGLTDTEKSNARTNLGLGSMATKSSLAESDIPSIPKSKISDFPTSLPANGGDSNTVNNHTVLSDVPANAVFTDTNTWRPLGTGATDACAGNDSRLSDSRPASDVYDWAKASVKPTYTASEVGAASITYEHLTTPTSGVYTLSPNIEYFVEIPSTGVSFTLSGLDGDVVNEYRFQFDLGGAYSVAMTNTIIWQGGTPSFEANKHYEISIKAVPATWSDGSPATWRYFGLCSSFDLS